MTAQERIFCIGRRQKKLPAEAEIEITFEDADGEEILTAEDAAEAEAVLDELTEIAGEILAEKPLAEDEVIVATEDGEIFTADNDADGRAFVEELADEVAEELNRRNRQRKHRKHLRRKARRRKSLRRWAFLQS